MSIEPKKLTGPGALIVSDLFFNHDVDGCVIHEGGQFAGYDEEKLLAEAKSVADAVAALNPGVAFTPEELVADYYSRL